MDHMPGQFDNSNDESIVPNRFQSVRGLRYAWPLILVFFLLTFSIGEFAYSAVSSDDTMGAFLDPVRRMYRSFYSFFRNMSPWLYLGIPICFVAQFRFPVYKGSRPFGAATRLDLVYTLFFRLFLPLLSPIFLAFLKGVYNDYLAFIQLSTSLRLSGLSEVILGYLLIDFLGWVHHLVRHKVPVFWEFHAVHHSQTDMNPFSNERVHPVDWFVANSIKFIPAFFFANSLNVALSYIAIHGFLDRLNHSNVRTNLGLLRYVLVTPQSHRVHHAGVREYYDKNFGVSTSIWDHLFRTQHRNYDVYPPTGIPDQSFPLESNERSSLANVLNAWVAQMSYPLKVAWRKSIASRALPT